MTDGINASAGRMDRCRIADVRLHEVDSRGQLPKTRDVPPKLAVEYPSGVTARKQASDQASPEESRATGHEIATLH
jgi:hypothetical protein